MTYVITIDTERNATSITSYADANEALEMLNDTPNINLRPISTGSDFGIVKDSGLAFYIDENSKKFFIIMETAISSIFDLTIPAIGGKFELMTTPMPFPGIDIEYIDDNEPADNTPEGDAYIRPRIVFEKPGDEYGANNHVRAFGWNTQEDYDWQYDFNDKCFKN